MPAPDTRTHAPARPVTKAAHRGGFVIPQMPLDTTSQPGGSTTLPRFPAPCRQGPRAAHDSGTRRTADIKWIVVHSAEASDDTGEDRTAEGVAAYFARESTQASTQLVVDRDSCVRMLPDLTIPWGASGANTNGLHLEICGRAGWTRTQWLERDGMLDHAAYLVARWCWQYRIPRAWVGLDGLKDGMRGITTHADVNAAFHRGTHWDPGKGFPRDKFLTAVKTWHRRITQERAR